MPEILSACDVAVVPSRWEEAFGFAAVEASACGLPVVAFDIGGLTEAVHHGETGLVVRAGDWSALADALVRCLADAELAGRLGRNGVAFSRSFSPEEAAETFMRFHETLAARAVSANGSP